MKESNSNSGFIFWNNRRLAELRFFERCLCCWVEYTRKHPNMMRAVDQSLLALAPLLDPALAWLVLPHGYNYRLNVADVAQKQMAPTDIRVLHFTLQKPWLPMRRSALRHNPYLLRGRSIYASFLREINLNQQLGALTPKTPSFSSRISDRIASLGIETADFDRLILSSLTARGD